MKVKFMRECYVAKAFSQSSLDLIEVCNEIIEDYQGQGFDLTLRQLYYQLVSRNVVANTERSYKRVGSILNDARLAGHVDWNAIVDRTREFESNGHWSSPAEIVRQSAEQFRYDLWETQPRRVEVWIEKDALVGVIEGVCRRNDVPFFSCRGYVSQSSMYEAAQRHLSHWDNFNQDTVILHLGDHDPSGMNMTDDIAGRLEMFGTATTVYRIALNKDQIEHFNPPPNPAKLTDSRAREYIKEHGRSSWELDAMEPAFLSELIERHIDSIREDEPFEKALEAQDEARQTLAAIAEDLEA